MNIFLVTGEISGDKHGAHLANAIRLVAPDAELYGVGGEMMRGAGVHVLSDISRYNAFQYRILPKIFTRGRMNAIVGIFREELRRRRYDAAVIIGLADDTQYVSMRMAGVAKDAGVPVVYYFAPHVWIWSGKKTRFVSGLFDRILTLFPEEHEAYAAAGARTEYIGHPIIDEIRAHYDRGREETLGRELRKGGEKLLAFFPGSRFGEIRYHLPVIEKTIDLLSARGDCAFAVSAVNEEFAGYIRRRFGAGGKAAVVIGSAYELVGAADAVVACSGTVTLEIAILEKPSIIIYRLPWITYLVGRCLLSFEHFGLPNIIAGREIVPELLQGRARPEEIARIAAELLSNGTRAQAQRSELRALKEHLGGAGALERAARSVLAAAGAAVSRRNG
jgi:lipid-A-disaccharide synthase